jgi:hypothetical protein
MLILIHHTRNGIPDAYPHNNRAQSVSHGSTRALPKQRSASIIELEESALRLSGSPDDSRGRHNSKKLNGGSLVPIDRNRTYEPVNKAHATRLSNVVTLLIWPQQPVMMQSTSHRFNGGNHLKS